MSTNHSQSPIGHLIPRHPPHTATQKDEDKDLQATWTRDLREGTWKIVHTEYLSKRIVGRYYRTVLKTSSSPPTDKAQTHSLSITHSNAQRIVRKSGIEYNPQFMQPGCQLSFDWKKPTTFSRFLSCEDLSTDFQKLKRRIPEDLFEELISLEQWAQRTNTECRENESSGFGVGKTYGTGQFRLVMAVATIDDHRFRQLHRGMQGARITASETPTPPEFCGVTPTYFYLFDKGPPGGEVPKPLEIPGFDTHNNLDNVPPTITSEASRLRRWDTSTSGDNHGWTIADRLDRIYPHGVINPQGRNVEQDILRYRPGSSAMEPASPHMTDETPEQQSETDLDDTTGTAFVSIGTTEDPETNPDLGFGSGQSELGEEFWREVIAAGLSFEDDMI